MSKTIVSPIAEWPGTVTISDPLTILQAQKIEAGLSMPEPNKDGMVWLTSIDGLQLPAIFACVEKWELQNMPENLTIDNFPASPRNQSHKLIEWLFENIRSVYLGEAEVPNE